jgi:hypothetical protein
VAVDIQEGVLLLDSEPGLGGLGLLHRFLACLSVVGIYKGKKERKTLDAFEENHSSVPIFSSLISRRLEII